MSIALAVVSILGISLLVWMANRVLPIVVCPICAGVFLTWLGLVTGHLVGYQVDLMVPALLMGGSVVGGAYQLEKKFRTSSVSLLLLWKILFIPAGFVAAYAVLQEWWATVLIAIILLVALALVYFFVIGGKESSGVTESDLAERMKNCC